MATVAAAHRPDFLRESSSYFMKNHHNLPRIPDWTMRMNPQSSQRKNREELSIELQKLSSPHINGTAIPSELRFDRLQPAEQESIREHKIEFGDFVVQEAVLDEEFWTAAWLRAETHWEGRSNDSEPNTPLRALVRYADNYKRKFTEQEFNALKRRRNSQIGQKCSCIVTVKKDQININHTGLKTVVGTLDLSIGNLLHGANFPGERVKASLFCSINKKGHRYGYVANLCVSQLARRQGIASNMLNFAIRLAKSNGAEQVFVHVHKNNNPAQDLYQKLGFEVVEIASPQFSAEQTHLLRFTV